ncbi:MAG: hypothetical protein JW873_01045 [Candidatus Saganbacteria bacterium]|nr:hypothetical protein [Candidatus Saganbacteria bacterium]
MTPSLSEVLARGGAVAVSSPAAASVNPAYLLAGLAFIFLAAFSIVKGVAVFRRGRLMPEILLETAPPLAELKAREKSEKTAFLAEALKEEKKRLVSHNAELQGKIEELNGALSNVRQTRNTLERSNLALLKESERLKAEKEKLVLKASVPLLAVAPAPSTDRGLKNGRAEINKKEGREPDQPRRKRGPRVS